MRVLVGFLFYPRGGSAHAARAATTELAAQGIEVTLLAGSRPDLGPGADAERFFASASEAGASVRAVDFGPAAASQAPVAFRGGPGTAPMHPSYEDRPGAEDVVFTSVADDVLELHVEAWARELRAAGGASADLLLLHHLTPLHEAALRVLPGVPIVSHIHGSELLMLERIERRPDSGPQAGAWAARLRRWAEASALVIDNNPSGPGRAARLLGLPEDRFLTLPNGFSRAFRPQPVDRRGHWRRHLVEQPRGWRPGGGPGSVAYTAAEVEAISDAPVLIYVGRFTRVKRVPLLISAFARAMKSLDSPASLVLLGGFPGEWEGEHPLEAIARAGAEGVFLAGWHGHAELPEFLAASDVLVHASVREAFGQVIVEAAACCLPAIAVDAQGPAALVADGETGWLVPPDSEEDLAAAIVAALSDPGELRRRGRAARDRALANYSWERIGKDLAAALRSVPRGG